jgi:P27 family predicted phage terminase small subunit
MKVLTEADWMTLANLCQTWSTLITAQEKLTEMGILYKSPSGYIMQSPLLAIVNQCVDTITKLSREFGLTPAARSRIISQSEPEPEEDLWKILSRPRAPRSQPEPEMKPQ